MKYTPIIAAVSAGMSLGAFDRSRNAVMVTREDCAGQVSAVDLRVPRTARANLVGAAGADLVAWIVRSDGLVGLVWKDGDRVRYSEGRATDLLSERLRQWMATRKWL